MKYAVFTVMTPTYTPEIIGEKLSDFGYHGVEWRVKNRLKETPVLLPDESNWYWEYNKATLDINDIINDAKLAASICDANRLEKLSLASYLMPRELEPIDCLLQAAAANGFHMIRLFPDKYCGDVNYRVLFNDVRRDLSQVASMAKRYGVRVSMEIHMGTIIPSASAAYRLVESLDPTYVGVVYDAGNFVYEGYEQYQFGLELLGPYVHHVHIKDARTEALADGTYRTSFCPIGQGQVRFDLLLKALKVHNYNGFLSFEDFSNEIPPDDKLIRNLAFIQSLWERS